MTRPLCEATAKWKSKPYLSSESRLPRTIHGATSNLVIQTTYDRGEEPPKPKGLPDTMLITGSADESLAPSDGDP